MTPETREYDEYFFPQTLEEIIDRLQEYAKCGLSINGRDASHARKWADKLRAELSRLRSSPAPVGGGVPLDGHDDALDEIRIYKDDPIRGVVEWGAINRTIAWVRSRLRIIPADLKRGGVVVPEIPTWEDGESKLRRGEKLTALEKFVMDHDWSKTDTQFRDGLEAVFDELRTSLRAQPAQEPTTNKDAEHGNV